MPTWTPGDAHDRLVDTLLQGVRGYDRKLIGACYAPDAVLHHPAFPEPIRGRDAILHEHFTFLSAFSDIDPAARTVLSGPHTVAVELQISATHSGPLELSPGEAVPPTGRRISVPTIWVLDINEAGLIIEERDYIDTASLLRQLGIEDI